MDGKRAWSAYLLVHGSVDGAGNGTMVMRWPTKESYVRDQKAVLGPNHPAGICDAIAKFRMNTVKLS
ncbi:MAG: hypothetical protein P8O70_19435, partial [SAR324 cluster bacterium]|nr:hypothetical protein [SAR324 cluster bacterium]